MHWVYSQIPLRMKLPLLHISCAWLVMLFTSLSLGSLDHKLEDNAIYPRGILWMLISQMSKIFTPVLYINPVTIILWYDITKCEFCYIASQQKWNALEKEDFPVILKSCFMLFKVSLGCCSGSGRSMRLNWWSLRQERRLVDRFLTKIRLRQRFKGMDRE